MAVREHSSAYYIYYRVRNHSAPDGLERARAFVRDVGAAAGVSAALLVKRGEPALWMETYEGVADPAAFEAVLAERVARWNMDELVAPGGERRIESFDRV